MSIRFAIKKKDAFDETSFKILAPQVRLELTTLRLTAECSAIELLRNIAHGKCGEPKE